MLEFGCPFKHRRVRQLCHGLVALQGQQLLDRPFRQQCVRRRIWQRIGTEGAALEFIKSWIVLGRIGTDRVLAELLEGTSPWHSSQLLGNNWRRFLGIARGSLRELESQLIISEQLGFASKDDLLPCQSLLEEVGRMLSVLIRRLSD